MDFVSSQKLSSKFFADKAMKKKGLGSVISMMWRVALRTPLSSKSLLVVLCAHTHSTSKLHESTLEIGRKAYYLVKFVVCESTRIPSAVLHSTTLGRLSDA